MFILFSLRINVPGKYKNTGIHIVCRHSFLIIVGLRTLLENLLMTLYGLALSDEMLDHFPLFDETVRHIELCNSVISYIQRNPSKLFSKCRG